MRKRQVLCYAARSDANDKAHVSVEAVRPEHPLAALLPCDNVFVIESHWYRDNPLVIREPGVDRNATAGAIQSDISRLAQPLQFSLSDDPADDSFATQAG